MQRLTLPFATQLSRSLLAALLMLLGTACMAESPLPQDGASDAPYDDDESMSEVEVSSTSQAVTAEFQFGIMNVAQGKVATQSSVSAGGVPARAVDGNTNGNYHAGSVSHTAEETNAFWQVDLGQRYFVLSVDVWNRTDCCADRLNGAKVQLLDDNLTVLMEKTLTGTTAKQTLSFLPGRSARFVRVVRPGFGILSLAEVHVNAPNAQLNTEDNFCWLPTYGRGVGTIPTECPGKQKDAGLCYNFCAPGYYGVGPVCWQGCPAGYTDDGALCRRDASIIAADNSRCPWYDKCGLTLSKGCSTCPAGYRNDGCTCRRDVHIFAKSSYGRGVGTPMSCGGGKEMDAGLCYNACRASYHGVGPVCWGSCPADYPVQCGAGCAMDEQACADSVATMITAPIEAVLNITELVLTAGTSAAVQVPLKVAMTTTQKAVMKSSLKAALKAFTKEIAQEMSEAALEGLAEETATQLMNANEQLMSGGTANIDLVSLGTSLDPTGLAAVGVAFAKPICQ